MMTRREAFKIVMRAANKYSRCGSSQVAATIPSDDERAKIRAASEKLLKVEQLVIRAHLPRTTAGTGAMGTDQDEMDYALSIAKTVLDRVNADPDDDWAIISRNLLRSEETVFSLKEANDMLLSRAEDAELELVIVNAEKTSAPPTVNQGWQNEMQLNAGRYVWIRANQMKLLGKTSAEVDASIDLAIANRNNKSDHP